MYMLNMVIILIVMYCNVVTAIDKIPTYLLRFNRRVQEGEGYRERKVPFNCTTLLLPAIKLHVHYYFVGLMGSPERCKSLQALTTSAVDLEALGSCGK